MPDLLHYGSNFFEGPITYINIQGWVPSFLPFPLYTNHLNWEKEALKRKFMK